MALPAIRNLQVADSIKSSRFRIPLYPPLQINNLQTKVRCRHAPLQRKYRSPRFLLPGRRISRAPEFQEDFARWRAYVRDAIIEPAIGRDVLALGAVRRPALLRQVFAIAAGSPARIVSLQKMQAQLQDGGALETVAHYLALLEDAYLVAPLEKYSTRVHRRRASPPKLVLLNNALLSAMHPNGAPDPSDEPERFGFWVENACLAFALNQGQQVWYWREEPLGIDAVFDGSWGKWAVEVRTGRFDVQALRGLLEFCRRHPAFQPLVITRPGDQESARLHGIESISWEDFLLGGPPKVEASRM